ncbi:MAG: 2-oxo acid dehydrogenase subunit E2 [Verrucomicrobia bacterium]|jgi:2-oxoglutarate dehydrogenase E2 component (dihydrolipoamide succinyltransferase)|nr:2-oxo acid dehydrogenase subunit E2 [Verrucomicrobiota bacterium]MBT7068583.1 2-oxo acid dehydrogenase subunit E2 [Verrucomicrobiota bacterium]MBT7699549.1 2-oxo acid dehydrogenase subunit E2 [Verrucomicrobiota bacterium]
MNKAPVLMPHMGQSIAEGTVIRWHKAVGERVQADETLVEVESDKVTFEVGSPAEGTVVELITAEGETAEVGTSIATIETEDDVHVSQNAIAAERADAVVEPEPTERKDASSRPGGADLSAALPDMARDWLSPSVARIALRHNVSMSELEALNGTGQQGRVTRHDLIEYIATRPATTGASGTSSTRDPVDVDALKEHGHVVPMSSIRRSIADHMVQSIHTSAHVTMVHALDVTQLVALRNGLKEEFKATHGVNITYTTIMLSVTGKLLRRFPNVNASAFGSYILQRDAINVGCAVALPDESLVVPVIRNTDTRSLPEIAKDLDRLVHLARNRQLAREDIDGGTFTISNFGTFGSLFGTPIINQPQVAILGMGAITKQPVPDGDSFRFADTLYLSLSFDHRVIDGAMAGRFFQGMQEGVLALTAEDLI